jgi:hypothetical protein
MNTKALMSCGKNISIALIMLLPYSVAGNHAAKKSLIPLQIHLGRA